MRIFLDANILFSAAKSDGAIRKLLGLLFDAGHELCVDTFVIEEAARNLRLKAAEPGLPDLLASMSVLPLAPRGVLDPGIELVEKDRPILGAAIHHRCDALLTGDRTHFGRLYGKTIEGVKIMSPAQLAGEV